MGGEVYKEHCSLPVLNIEFTSEVVARARSPTRREIYLLPLGFSASLTPSLRTPLAAKPLSFLPVRGPNLDRKTLLRTRTRKASLSLKRSQVGEQERR